MKRKHPPRFLIAQAHSAGVAVIENPIWNPPYEVPTSYWPVVDTEPSERTESGSLTGNRDQESPQQNDRAREMRVLPK